MCTCKLCKKCSRKTRNFEALNIRPFSGFLLGIFFGGGRQNLLLCKFLLLCYCFRTKFQGGAKVSGGQPVSGDAPCPLWKKASFWHFIKLNYLMRDVFKTVSLSERPSEITPKIQLLAWHLSQNCCLPWIDKGLNEKQKCALLFSTAVIRLKSCALLFSTAIIRLKCVHFYFPMQQSAWNRAYAQLMNYVNPNLIRNQYDCSVIGCTTF